MSDIDRTIESLENQLKELEELVPLVDLVVDSAKDYCEADGDDKTLNLKFQKLSGAVALFRDVEDKIEQRKQRKDSNIYSLDERREEKARETGGG